MTQENLILDTDSYKASHWLQYPKDTENMFLYIEARKSQFDDATVFFGMQYIIKKYLSTQVTMEMVEEAKEIFELHGEPFNYEGWKSIVTECNGYIPLKIRAVPEGMRVPLSNILSSIEPTNENFWWVASWFETQLMRVWYPTTVASISYKCKQIIQQYIDLTSDDQEQIAFKLHDFGSRGVNVREGAGIGGVSHLVNFMGTDTVQALVYARKYYLEKMAGFSIPAAEHNSILVWGKDKELEAYDNMLKQFAKPNSLVAIVSDSYDIYNAVDKIWGQELRQKVIDSGATIIIRPDSGIPEQIVLQVCEMLENRFGSTINSKGYRVLNNVRVIQGDGINPSSINSILHNLEKEGYAVDNVAFGMGGALLQQCNRDTFSFAMKASAVKRDGVWYDTFKSPITDPTKTSKKGRMTLVQKEKEFKTILIEELEMFKENGWYEVLETVFENGKIIKEYSLQEIRENAKRN